MHHTCVRQRDTHMWVIHLGAYMLLKFGYGFYFSHQSGEMSASPIMIFGELAAFCGGAGITWLKRGRGGP